MIVMARKLVVSSIAKPLNTLSFCNSGRYGCDRHGECWGFPTTVSTKHVAGKQRRCCLLPLASFALAETPNSSKANFYKKVLEAAREKFTQEISLRSKDKDISLAKALLYIAAEDETFLAFNREMDACSVDYNAQEWELDAVETLSLASKNINKWLVELDAIAEEFEAALGHRGIGSHFVEVLEVVNKVLFDYRHFRRLTAPVDSNCLYLHTALRSGCASAILLSVTYIEVCRRLNLTIVGSRVGEEFLIWPPTGNPEELFKVTLGRSLFGVINGKCVDNPSSMASDIDSNSLSGLEIATNRDIVGIALANLIRFYWKCASRSNHGLMLTSPLRPVQKSGKLNRDTLSPLLRTAELRLALMVSERLLILQPHNWALRRDYGMMLCYNREYEAAVQELSMCMALTPEEEAQVLEPFIEKLYLMLLEISWMSFGQKGC